MASIGLLKATVRVKVEMPVWQLWLHDSSLGIFSTRRKALLALYRFRKRPENKHLLPYWTHSKNGLNWRAMSPVYYVSRLQVVEDRVR